MAQIPGCTCTACTGGCTACTTACTASTGDTPEAAAPHARRLAASSVEAVGFIFTALSVSYARFQIVFAKA